MIWIWTKEIGNAIYQTIKEAVIYWIIGAGFIFLLFALAKLGGAE